MIRSGFPNNPGVLSDTLQRQSVYSDVTPSANTANRHSLRDVLSNPGSLSYFMEFMDRRNRSLFVQFWLTVESFKNPLESVESDSEDDENDLPDNSGLSLPSSPTIVEDMTMIRDLYFSAPTSLLFSVISQKHIDAIRGFVLDPSNVTPTREKRVRKSVLLAQKQVQRNMEEDFEDFERSELWFRAVSDLAPKARTGNKSAPTSPPPLTHRETSPLSPGNGSAAPRPISKGKAHPTFAVPLNRTESAPVVPRTGDHNDLFGLPPQPKSATNLEFLIGSNEAGPDPSRAPLFGESDEPPVLSPDEAQSQRIEAIQAALTDIIADEKRHSTRQRSASSASDIIAPSITSLGSGPLPEARKRGAPMFNDVAGQDYQGHEVQEDDNAESGFQLAGPGDLQLAFDISRLGEKITKLESQATILEAFMRKAELTGDAQELRLLNKSKSAMARELRELTFQKAQYEQQEAENKLLPSRTRVAIVNSAMADEEGKQVVKYLIEVQQLAGDGSFASGWAVARRYNDFFGMHQRLKERYAAVRTLDFPGKRLVTSMSASFVDQRKIGLEKYLQVSCSATD